MVRLMTRTLEPAHCHSHCALGPAHLYFGIRVSVVGLGCWSPWYERPFTAGSGPLPVRMPCSAIGVGAGSLGALAKGSTARRDGTRPSAAARRSGGFHALSEPGTAPAHRTPLSRHSEAPPVRFGGGGATRECGEGENAPTGDYAGLGRCGWITTGVTLNAQAKPERGSYRVGNCPQRGDAQPSRRFGSASFFGSEFLVANGATADMAVPAAGSTRSRVTHKQRRPVIRPPVAVC